MKIGRLHLGRNKSAVQSTGAGGPSLSETVTLLRRYVVQETVGPIKRLGRVLAYGLAGALAFGLGGLFVVVGVLRLTQAESGTTFAGNWSFAPYLFAAIAGVALVAAFVALTVRGLNGDRHGAGPHREEP
ncbi:MAG TPA: hypothetical protein VNF07_09830 [Acidimicrobiales bacterium]|nr:hypothetical protein [Acidimicrobiales bacterium]